VIVNYLIGATYVGTDGTEGVVAGADAEPHDAESGK